MSISGDWTYVAASGDGERGCSGCDEIMLFGVRVKVDPMRKCVSMSNLTDYEPANSGSNLIEKSGDELLPKVIATGGGAAGYTSADDVVRYPSSGSRERNRGVPWTEEEHKLFLIGLQKVGKGDWRGISRNYVKTRTPTQVASHAQKYFIRQINQPRRRRRSSVFDMTTDSITSMQMEQQEDQQDSPAHPVPQPISMPLPVPSKAYGFAAMPFPVTSSHVHGNISENAALSESDRANNSSSMVDLNGNHLALPEPSPLLLTLSLSSSQDPASTADSLLPGISAFKNDSNAVIVA